jgi:ABC-type multidrug transport system fused ATPase/permease subunit
VRNTVENAPSPRKKTDDLVRFLRYVRPYWKWILLSVIGGVVKFVVPLFVPQVLRYLIDDVFSNKAMSIDQKWHETVFWLGLFIGIFVFIFSPLVYIRHAYAPRAGNRAVFDLRCDLYQHILRMSTSFFDRNRSGSILSRLTSDVQLAENLIGNALTNTWMDAAAVVVVIVFLFRIDTPSALVALATLPFYAYAFKKFSKHIKSTTRQVQDELANMSGGIQEKLSGNIVVQAFAQEDAEDRRFLGVSERLFSVSMLRVYWQSLNNMVIATLTSISPLIVMMFTGYRVIYGNITIGELIAINMYLGPFYLPIQRFAELNVVFANSMAALERIFEFMDEQPDVKDPEKGIDAEGIRGDIELDNVSFEYSGARKPVLHNATCHLAAGENVAIVGPSGSGKSTMVGLVPRFYDVTSGEIRIDGHPVKGYDLRSLRRQVGMVLQDPILFSGTIRDNIRYGKPEASEDDLLRACEAANVLEFIRELPDGFDTEVGERGVLLSGGQKQRLTIARAFLTNPKILILDEATSSLDSESERLIQDALGRLIEGRTTFTIAHRLSTVLDADRILVLLQGRIVGQGTHAELLESCFVYKRLYEQQFEHLLPGPSSSDDSTSQEPFAFA